MSVIGYASLQIIPSAKGSAGILVKEMAGPAKQAGEKAGDEASKGLADKLLGGAKKAALAVGGLLAVGIKESMDVEGATDKLAAQLGATGPEAERLGSIAGHLYAGAYGDSMDEVTSAVDAVVSSIGGMRDASSSAVEAVTAKVLDLASAFGVDTARAAQVAGEVVTAGLAKDATQALDLITASMQKVPSAVREDLLDAFDEYGPFLKTVGLTGQKAFELLVGSAAKGAFGLDKTGDAIKEFTIRVGGMDQNTKSAFAAIGVNTDSAMKAMTNALLGGGEKGAAAFDKVIKGLQGIKDPATQAQAALGFFGTPLEDLSVAEIPKFLASLTSGVGALSGFEGAAKRMGDTLNDNAKSNLTSFWRQAQMAFVDLLGGKVIPIVNGVTKFLATNFGPALELAGKIITTVVVPALSAAVHWVQQNGDWLKIVAGVIAAIFIPYFVAMGVAATVNAAKTVAAFVVMKAEAIASAAVHSGAILGMIGQWVLLGVESLANAAKVAAAWLISLGPVGWVIGAIAAIVAAFVILWNKSEDFRNFWIGLWENVKNAALVARDWIVDKWNGFIRFVEGIPGAVGRALSTVADVITWPFKQAFNGIARLWNNTVGRLNFSIPSWVPGIGGNSFGVPQIPLLAQGGIAKQATLAMIGEGSEPEAVLPLSRLSAMLAAGAPVGSDGARHPAGGAPINVEKIEVNVPNAFNALSKSDLRKVANTLKDELRELERSRT